ncbi:endolytic transglycosylase MltG [Candidatus Dojkabacteria bacterium]|nr:endolytic transglycosylase MltG [Candidatus Dojkabacteria bacterium]
MKLLRVIALFIFISVIAVAGYLYFNYARVTSGPLGTSSEKVRFEIEEGDTGTVILEKLASANIIKAKDIPYLKVFIRVNKVPDMKEGVFRIPQDLTASELFDLLQNPENPDIWITLREGLRKDTMAEILEEEFSKEEEGVFKADRFLTLTEDPAFIATLGLDIEGLANLEGFLYPDKYLFPKQATEEYVITVLVNTFITKTGGVYTYEDIIIASMVEREGMTNEDRPMIADIIKRRLDEGWLLQIDATLLYYYKDWKRVLTKEDLALDQQYNTYKRAGLPPTPICNPGISAINATKNPKANNYYFYMHSKNGTPYYGVTYQDHLLNISKYLR